MKKINLTQIKEEPWQSPDGKYAISFKGISEALGREPASLDVSKRHPFDWSGTGCRRENAISLTTRTRLNGSCIWSFREKPLFATRMAGSKWWPATRSFSARTSRIK